MDRRRFLKIAGAGFAAMSVPGLAGAAARKDKRPNILFIMSDDHTSQAIGAYGKRMRRCAWKAVVNNPHTGITDKNENGIADEIEEAPGKDSRSSTAGESGCGVT